MTEDTRDSNDDGTPPDPLGLDDGFHWTLKLLHDDDSEDEVLRITREGLTIGRATSNDLVLSSEKYPGVSSSHSRLVFRDGEINLEDLASRNGTLVGGKKVSRVRLQHGDVFELGHGGPRFLVLSPSSVGDTVVMSQRVEVPGREMGPDTVEMVRQKLGIPAHTLVTDVVQREHRANRALLVTLILLLFVGGGYGIAIAMNLLDEVRVDRDQLRIAQEALDRTRLELERSRSDLETEHSRRWEQAKTALLQERAVVEKQLAALRATSGRTEELNRLKEQFRDVERKIEQYDPEKLKRDRLATVEAVRTSVVLIEVQRTYVDPDSKKALFIDRGTVNMDGRGEIYSIESTGSGFCFSEEGWILTNAHVVERKRVIQPLVVDSLVLEPKIELNVVFSGTRQRRLATFHDASSNPDLALIKIKPFAKMPHLDSVDIATPQPTTTTPVILLGFPLGTNAMQDGRKVIASAFRGIVSRSVADFLQVDAAVHPGNSGGPVIDETGRVIGVVVGMQRLGSDLSAAAMGYVIPIRLASVVWPPKPKKKKKR